MSVRQVEIEELDVSVLFIRKSSLRAGAGAGSTVHFQSLGEVAKATCNRHSLTRVPESAKHAQEHTHPSGAVNTGA